MMADIQGKTGRKSVGRRYRRSSLGFTMIEMMVAGVLLVTVTTIVYGSFAQTFRVRDHTEKFYDRYRDLRMAMHRMSKEISMAYLSTHHNQEEPRTSTCFKGEENRLTFTSFAHLRMERDAQEGDQVEIGYYIDTVPGVRGDRTTALMRREDTNLDTQPLRGGVRHILAENVTRVRFEYWDPTREIAGEAWVREWDACQEGNTVGDRFPILPERVKITLEYPALIGNRTETLVVETQIMIREALRF